MEKKQLQLIKSALPKHSILPIIENVLIADGFLVVTDLETTVTLPFRHVNMPMCIEAKKFITAMEIMPDAMISGQSTDEGFKTTFEQGSKKITIGGDDTGKYPETPSAFPADDPEMLLIGAITEQELPLVKSALQFVTNDDLRPAMTGIYFNKTEICSTDAHRLYWRKIPNMNQDFIMPAKTAKILLQAGGDWKVYYRKKADEKQKYAATLCTMIREDGTAISFRPIEAQFPNYKNVIPDFKKSTGNVTLYKKELIKELSNALKFANPETNQVLFSINGKTTIQSQDIDLAHEYQTEIQSKITGDSITFALNGKLLSDIVAMCGDNLNVIYFTPQSGFIIDKQFLIMPLMIK